MPPFAASFPSCFRAHTLSWRETGESTRVLGDSSLGASRAWSRFRAERLRGICLSVRRHRPGSRASLCSRAAQGHQVLYLVRFGLERSTLAARSCGLKRSSFNFSSRSPHPISGHDLSARRPAFVSARAVQIHRQGILTSIVVHRDLHRGPLCGVRSYWHP